MNNAIYLRRRGKIALPTRNARDLLPISLVATTARNVEALGFALSQPLIEALRRLVIDEFLAIYQQLIEDLQHNVGAHRTFKPMYPNFPSQVMEMSEAQLYFNAIVHYWTAGRFLPVTDKSSRNPLDEPTELRWIDLGTREEFEQLFGQIASSNASLSEQDREDLDWFVREYGDHIEPLMPDSIRQKETLAFLAGLLVKHSKHAAEFIQTYCKTATDVLRLAAALSDGDVSLATNAKFRTFSRPERRLLLSLVDRQPNAIEDMLRYPERWKRLGEKLHAGEFKARYPKAFEAFNIIRNDLPYTTFNSAVEQALAGRQVDFAVKRLASRPGDFARRLDHLLRLDEKAREQVLTKFASAARRVSTPVLLQLRQHFISRNDLSDLRVFFPKGNLARAQAAENALPVLPLDVCERAAALCESALLERFRALPALGRCYVDEGLKRFMAPFAMRSASKTLRTLVRGSRLLLPDCSVLRFFLWWKNGVERTDIDLSAAMFDARYCLADIVSYYNLKAYGGCHSGDIVDAPNGASEFIDLDLKSVREKGIRYVVMTLSSYTQQPYCDLPECFAGWMARREAGSGDIYEPRTVQDKLDVTADTRIAIPMIVDLAVNQVIWCDMALKRDPRWQNNVHGNLKGINLTLQAMVELKKPNLYDLFVLHARARGELVPMPKGADTVFSVENGMPFRLEEIASQYMA